MRLTLPMWLLRMSPDGRMDINRDEVGLENVRLSIEDLEAAGPGPLFVRKTRGLARARLGRVAHRRRCQVSFGPDTSDGTAIDPFMASSEERTP